MTDTAQTAPRQSLGVGSIFSETFSIFFKKLPAALLLAFIPALVAIVLTLAPAGQAESMVDANGELVVSRFIVVFFVSLLVTVAAISLATAGIVQLAYDAKLDRPTNITRYLATAIRNLPAVLVLSIAVGVLYTLGGLLLIIPGIWVLGVFSVVVPAIVIEGAGFGGLRRSAELTRGYRWPIVGALALVYLILILVSLAVGAVVGVVVAAIGGSGLWLSVILESVGSAIGYGLASIAVALIFARLKEIKEGVSVADLVDVFR